MAKMGRPRNVETPEEMSALFEKYVKTIEPRIKIEYVGKDGERVETPLKTPLTFEGFKDFCWDESIGDVEQYFTNLNDAYTDFLGICSRIKNKIRRDQIEGGMVGQYNPSITQRLNNLKESTDTVVRGSLGFLNIDPLDDSTDDSTQKNIEP
jgi:hypothetical protein